MKEEKEELDASVEEQVAADEQAAVDEKAAVVPCVPGTAPKVENMLGGGARRLLIWA